MTAKLKNIIKYKGLKDLTKKEELDLKAILNNEYERIHRLIKNITDLTVNIKLKNTKGTRKRYIIDLRVESPTRIFTTKKKERAEWDLKKATHKAVATIKKEIEHSLHSNTPTWKRGGIKKLIQRFGFYK